MKLTLWRDDAVIRRPIAAAAERHDVRARLFLRVEHDGVHGYGEVAPESSPLNGDPSVDEVVEELASRTLAQLVAVVEREGTVPSWTRVARFAAPRASSATAVALVEMAILDYELRSLGQDTATLWPRHFLTPTQSAASLLDDEPWAIPPTVARVRVKTSPGPVSRSALLRLEELSKPVVLDFNCSARIDADVLDQVALVSRHASLVGVEQPFNPGNVADHARLAQRLDVALSLDEGVRNPRDLDQIARYHAATMVCVKPARVGGLAVARSMFEQARRNGLSAYLGGFFESAFARGVNGRLAANCVDQPSDLGVVERSDFEGAEVIEVAGGFEIAPSEAMLRRASVVLTLD